MQAIGFKPPAGAGGARAQFVQIPTALLSTPTGDPNGIFVEARNEANGWVEVDYTDGANDYGTLPSNGVRFDLGDIPSALGVDYASMDIDDLVTLAIEIDDNNRNGRQVVNLIWSNGDSLTVGNHLGVSLHLSAAGLGFGRIVRGAAQEVATAAGHADANLARVRFVRDAAAGSVRAKDVQTFDVAAPGTVLESANSLTVVGGYTAQDRLMLSVGRFGGGTGTKTARFRLRVLALTTADLYTLGG